MNAFSYYRGIESFSETPTYVNLEKRLQLGVWSTDLDNYSDLSEDTLSSLSFDSSEYTNLYELDNRNCFDHPDIRTLEEAWMKYGNMSDQSILTSLELTNTHQSSRFSDVEMTELFLLEEQQRLEYLAEMVYVEADIEAADYFAKRYSGTAPKAYRDVEPLSKDPVYFLNHRNSISNKIEACLKMEPLPQQRQCFRKNGSRVSLKSNSWTLGSKQMKSKQISPKAHTSLHLPHTAQASKQCAKKKSTKPQRKVSEVNQIPPEAIQSIRKNDNDKDKAKEASFPCVSKYNSDDDRKIFLGGLPIGMTERTLRWQMSTLGYKVLKRPKILRGFAPEVWMKSVKQAQELVAKKTIMLKGVNVEVRPYNWLTKPSKSRKIPNVRKRSVFLGGLPDGTTARDIKQTLMKMRMKVLNKPVITDRFSRQVILESVSQAARLINMRKILLNGKLVDIRPFVKQFNKGRSH